MIDFSNMVEKGLSEKSENAIEPVAAGFPKPEELAVLSGMERAGFNLVHRMNSPRWKPFWTFFQKHIGSLWIYLATNNLMNVRGFENFANTDPERPLILVANHRSFFDMYTVSSVIFRGSERPIELYFPVRAKFFYDRPLGWFVNLVMGWWAMYPPFFREKNESEKREFDKFSVRKLTELASRPGTVLGFHPEGKRNLSEDAYDLLPAQPGIGKVIMASRPAVIPVFITGLINDLPKQILGNWRGGPKVRIWFGEEIDLRDFYEKRDSLRTHKEIADHLMAKIAELGELDRAEFVAAEKTLDQE